MLDITDGIELIISLKNLVMTIRNSTVEYHE